MHTRRVLVTMYNAAPWGGLHENIWHAARGSRQRGWDVTVACRPGPLVNRLQTDGITVHLIEDWDNWTADADKLARHSWDLIHSHTGRSRELALHTSRANGAP